MKQQSFLTRTRSIGLADQVLDKGEGKKKENHTYYRIVDTQTTKDLETVNLPMLEEHEKKTLQFGTLACSDSSASCCGDVKADNARVLDCMSLKCVMEASLKAK